MMKQEGQSEDLQNPFLNKGDENPGKNGPDQQFQDSGSSPQACSNLGSVTAPPKKLAVSASVEL